MINLIPSPKTTWLLCLIIVLISGCREDAINPDNLLQKWQVISIREHATALRQTAAKPYILEFKTNNHFTFQRDVNLCPGEYIVPEPGKISFTRMGCTEICCDTRIAETTTGIFSGVKAYSLEKGILTLSGDGEIKLKKVK